MASVAGLSDGIVAGACLLSAVVIFSLLGRRGTWQSAPWLGLAVLALALVNGLFLIHDLTGTPRYRPTSYDLIFLPAAALFLLPIRVRVPRRTSRRKSAARSPPTSALIAASLAAILYLSIRPISAGTTEVDLERRVRGDLRLRSSRPTAP